MHGNGIAKGLGQGAGFLEEVVFLLAVFAGGTGRGDVEDDAVRRGRGRGGGLGGVVLVLAAGLETGGRGSGGV